MWAAAAVAPAAVAPTFRTATPTPRSAARASASASRAPSPSASRKSATAPTSSSSASAASSVAASSTAWLPTDATVWKRSPRPTASAFTAKLPLCEISATRPGGRGTSASPQRAAAPWNETSPSQLGPSTGIPAAAAASSCWSAGAPASAKPAANTTAAPQPRRRGGADHVGHAGGGDRDDCGVDRLGQVVERGHAAPPVHLAPRRVDAPDGTGEPERGEVAQHRVPVGAGPVGRPDDGDRARAQQRGEIGRDDAPVARRAQRSTCSTPRRSSERAIISRWISLVPSQILSTRSSRRKRSATLSRL